MGDKRMAVLELSYVFCGLMAISRGLDLLSTWLVTPKMTLEAGRGRLPTG